jgi:hypothetical protein
MGLLLQPTASVTGATQTLGIPFVDARITILPRFIRVPDERSLNGRSWKSRHLEQIECMTHDLTLHRTISRLPTRIAEWEIAEEKSWNATFFDNVAGGADDHCRDPLRFEIACDQTHGLVTDGSERHQQGDVDSFFEAARCDLRRILFEGSPLAVVRGNTMEALRERSDSTVPNQGAQCCERNEGLDIVGMRILSVPGEVIRIESIGRAFCFTRPHLLDFAMASAR